ncbi:MAG: hypothetical protein R6V01_11080, partial [Thermoplasmatota archaeon]
IMERETITLDLLTDHTGNGTIHFNMETDEDWISLDDDRLVLSPVDGDHGTYSFEISSNIVGGPSNPFILTVEVSMNLSTLECSLLLEPPGEEYELGTIISYEILLSGYEAPLEPSLMVRKDGEEMYRFHGTNGTIEMREKGSYELGVDVNGHDPLGGSVSFRVVEEDTDNGYGYLILILFLVLISASAVCGYLYWKRSRRTPEKNIVGTDRAPPEPSDNAPYPKGESGGYDSSENSAYEPGR